MSGAEVWAISTRKGGVLKTSLTVNMAGALSNNKRILIVDLDSQGNVYLSFGKNPDKLNTTIYDVLTNRADIRKAICKVHKNIDVLPANDDMGDFDFEVIPNKAKYPNPFDILKEKLEPIRDQYDYILIDTPPNFGLIQGNALNAAQKVLVPYQPENYSMRALIKIINTIKKFKERYNPELELVGVIATLVDMRTSLHCEIMESTRKFCRKNNIPLLKTVIPKSIKFAASIAYEKKPATISVPTHKAVENYFELIDEVIVNG